MSSFRRSAHYWTTGDGADADRLSHRQHTDRALRGQTLVHYHLELVRLLRILGPAAHFPCLPGASFPRSGFCFALLRDALRQFLPSGFAIPPLVNFGRDLALDKELRELASLSLGFDRHASGITVAVRWNAEKANSKLDEWCRSSCLDQRSRIPLGKTMTQTPLRPS